MRTHLFILFIILFSVSCQNGSEKVNEAGEKTLAITYCNYEKDTFIERYTTKIETIDFFKQLPRRDSSFLTINITETEVIKFEWQTHNRECLVEITDVENEKIYKQRYANYEECIELIKTIFTGNIHKASGFTSVTIMSN
ncbi:MAG: hypothetical protein E6772_11950 [Dysgonomonas sp.]|nr:hypothetical protein [Dysgonomonas sp.]